MATNLLEIQRGFILGKCWIKQRAIQDKPSEINTSMIQSPNPILILDRCKTIREIQNIHAQTIKIGVFDGPIVATKIIHSCCSLRLSDVLKSEEVDYIFSVFDISAESSSFLYNSLIRFLCEIHRSEEALLLFYRMLCDSSLILPDEFTFPFVLKSCTQLAAIEECEQIHSFILKTQFLSNIFVRNSLVNTYIKCKKMDYAFQLFDKMPERNLVTWNTMIDGFAKYGNISAARILFDRMPERNIVSWNTMIAGYCYNSLFYEALELFVELQISGIKPDKSTIVSIISVVSNLGRLGLARSIDGYVLRQDFSLDGTLGSTLINMYSKCGKIDSAFQVFARIPNKNVWHWTSMISGCASHGLFDCALKLFSQMRSVGVKPNDVTFVGVLNACSHAGLVEEGLNQFKLMTSSYGIEPSVQHYGCLVDILSRSGHLKDAMLLVKSMPFKPGQVIWNTLLSASKERRNIEIAETAAQKLFELSPDYGGGYVLLANIYANYQLWDDFSRIRKIMEEKKVQKTTGYSWIEVNGESHEFVVGDRFHPRSKDICSLLNHLDYELRYEGYRENALDSFDVFESWQ